MITKFIIKGEQNITRSQHASFCLCTFESSEFVLNVLTTRSVNIKSVGAVLCVCSQWVVKPKYPLCFIVVLHFSWKFTAKFC